MPSTTVAYRSKSCTMSWPMKASATSSTTMISRLSQSGSPVRLVSAKAPLTELVANQPRPAITVFRAAGRMLPRVPNATRPSTIWATPSRGPQLESTPWVRAPSALPSTMAATACQKLRPKNATAITPTKIVANSRFGALQVASSCHGEPWRRSSGIASIPPCSTMVLRAGSVVTAVTG